jgi:hypothetical protein
MVREREEEEEEEKNRHGLQAKMTKRMMARSSIRSRAPTMLNSNAIVLALSPPYGPTDWRLGLARRSPTL